MASAQNPTAASREEFPKAWSDIIGHAEIVRRLRVLVVTGRLPHALLLTGADGIGKRRTARVLARTLLCASGDDAPCGCCDACRTMAAGVHPDYFEIAPEARGKSAAMIRTDAVREILLAVSGAPIASARRIILIDDADRMNETAANRLLKTLEEPAGEILFLLVTSAYDAVLPTIRSRAVRIAFGALTRMEIEDALRARGAAEDAAVIAALSDGSLGRAYTHADEGLALRDDALTFLMTLPTMRAEDIWARATRFDALDPTARRSWLGFVQMGLRDLLVLGGDGASDLLFHTDRRAELAALLTGMGEEQIFAVLTECQTLMRRLEANVSVALQAEASLIRIRQQFV